MSVVSNSDASTIDGGNSRLANSSTAAVDYPLSPRSNVEKQFQEAFVSLRKKKTDGKDKAKSLEKLCLIIRDLNYDAAQFNPDNTVKSIRPLLVHRSGYLRASAVRVIRYLCRAKQAPQICWHYHCHFFLAKMFDNDKKSEKEKKQVMELMRQISRSKTEAQHVPLILVKCLVSVADNTEDSFRSISIEILRDLLLRNPRVVAQANGMKTLLNTVLDSKFEDIAESIIVSFLYIADHPLLRRFLRPKYDLEFLLNPLTQGYIQEEDSIKSKWLASRKAITLMMKSWTGLICMTNEGVGIISLVEALKLPEKDDQRQQMIFDTIIDIMRAVVPQQYQDLIPALSSEKEQDSKLSHLNVLKRTDSFSLASSKGGNLYHTPIAPFEKPDDSLLMSFTAMVIFSFVHYGLVDALVYLSRRRFEKRASQILQSVLVFADMLLPPDLMAHIHAKFDSDIVSFMSTERLIDLPAPDIEESSQELLRSITKANTQGNQRAQGRMSILSKLTSFCQYTKVSYKRRLVRAEVLRTAPNISIDDALFSQMVKDSNVLLQRDVKRWNWDVIYNLIFGPLRAPSRLYDGLKTKFVKRLIAYFKPYKKQFCELLYKEEHMKFSSMGCQLIENLLSVEDGFHFLSNSGFLSEIYQMLLIETKPNPELNANRILTEEKVTYTMTRDYFTFVGSFSSFPQGIKLLQDFKILQVLSELITKRDDISQLVIKNLDYRLNDTIAPRQSVSANLAFGSPTRRILKEAMISGSKKIRYFSTLRMKKLSKDCVSDFHLWGIELLAKQLPDEWEDVAKNSLRILVETCHIDENLDALIAAKPNIELLESSVDGRFLLLKMLSRTTGFQNLKLSGWLDANRERWLSIKNAEYSKQVEVMVRNAMMNKPKQPAALTAAIEEFILPPHFYGELCKTREGCGYIQSVGDVQYFLSVLLDTEKEYVDSLDEHNNNKQLYISGYNDCSHTLYVNEYDESDFFQSDNVDDILMIKKRSALWALGAIGANDIGFNTFFEDSDSLKVIVQLAISSPCLSFRGSCFFVLSNMTKSACARQKLRSLGWECRVPHNESIANYPPTLLVVIPQNPEPFFCVPEYEYEGCSANFEDPYSMDDEDLLHNKTSTIPPNDESNTSVSTSNGLGGESIIGLHLKILTQVAVLANPVTEAPATKALRKYKATNPELFDSPQLLFKVLFYLNKYRYSLRAKQLLFDLFQTVQYEDEDFDLLDQFYSKKFAPKKQNLIIDPKLLSVPLITPSDSPNTPEEPSSIGGTMLDNDNPSEGFIIPPIVVEDEEMRSANNNNLH